MMRLLAFPLSIFLAASLLAEEELKNDPQESSDIEPPLLIQEIPSRIFAQRSSRKWEKWENGLTFGITEVTTTDSSDANGEKNMTLKIGVDVRPNTLIDQTKVKIQVFFYDTVDNKQVVLTNAHVSYAWVTPHHDWKNTKPAVLKVTYLRPPKKINPLAIATDQSKDAYRNYLGYIVRVYYNGQRQAVRADPPGLLKSLPSSSNIAFELTLAIQIKLALASGR